MAGEIQVLFNKYQQKYPLYTKEAIVDTMLKDGVITPDIAKKIKSGTSLFLLDNSFSSKNTNKDLNMTEIFGGSFRKQKAKPKTNFNRQIEATFQSKTQGDCWLLSDINALNCTEWGRKAIHDAIIPDANNTGGVTIKFKGSPLKQKSFHISANEIIKAKKSGNYAKGDDDMIAFELATEKLSKMIEKAGLGKRVTGFDGQINHKSYIAGGGMYNKNGDTMDISALITGRKDVMISFTRDTKVPDEFLKKLAKNNDNTASVCTFNSMHDVMGRAKDDPVHGNHAYAIKNIEYGKSVTVIDPYHADKEIKLSWKKFLYDVERITISSKDNSVKNELESLISQQLKNEILEAGRNSAKMNDKNSQRQIDVKIWEQTFPEVAKILIGFDIPKEEIKFNKVNDIIKTDFLKKNDFSLTYDGLSRKIPFDKRKPSTEKVNKDNVLLLLDVKPDFIQFLDKSKSGWGKGEEKKQLISPIINALAEKAKEVEIDNKTITDFKTKCNKELDAIFYTDEKVIQKEVDNIIKLIKAKEH